MSEDISRCCEIEVLRYITLLLYRSPRYITFCYIEVLRYITLLLYRSPKVYYFVVI